LEISILNLQNRDKIDRRAIEKSIFRPPKIKENLFRDVYIFRFVDSARKEKPAKNDC
jgi:hypothetical protein